MDNVNGHDRLLEYFFICDEETVLDRFPLEDHHDTAFPLGVTMFCFPTTSGSETSTMEMPKFFEFVLTGGDGSHMYGYVLMIYEQHRGQGDQAGLVCKRKCLGLLSYWPFRSQFRTFLTQLYRISISPITMPLERIIGNFVLEVPLPPPGCVRVQYQIGDTELIFTRPPTNNPIAWTDIGFQHVFESLDLDNILKVFSAMLTERQILMRSSSYSLLTACGEVFRALIYPFVWRHVYIPILPEKVLRVMHAPLPYLIGIHEDLFGSLKIPENAVVVNLDENTVFASSHDLNCMDLPVHDRKKLYSRLSHCAPAFANRSKTWTLDDLPLMDSAFSHAARPYEIDTNTDAKVRQMAQSDQHDYDFGGKSSVFTTLENGECNWPMVRVAFFRFFVSLLRDYNDFFLTKNKEFDTKAFLAKRKRAALPFLTIFVGTQMFLNFIDDRRHFTNDADVEFFQDSVKAKSNRSVLSFFKKSTDTPFLDDRRYAITKTVVAYSPDTSPIPLNIQWMPQNAHGGYEIFPPRLNRALFGKTRPKQTITLPNGLVHQSRMNQKQRTKLDLKYASDAIYATWFLLFCSAIGVTTEYQQQLLQQQGTFKVMMSPSSVASSRSSFSCRGRHSSVSSNDTYLSSSSEEGEEEDEEDWSFRNVNNLDIAFQVLEASRKWSNNTSEFVYRILMEACGRVGHTDYAIKVLGLMHEAGFVIDSNIYGNLVQSFSMNKTNASTLKLDVFDWNALEKEVNAANYRIELSKKHHRRKLQKKIRKRGGRRRRSFTSHAPLPSVRRTLRHWGSRSSSHQDQQDQQPLEKKSSLLQAALLYATTSNVEKVSTPTSSSMNQQQQLLQQEQASHHIHTIREPVELGHIFPSLVIDTEKETCPKCGKRVPDEDIRMGWNNDPNDYNTECKNCKNAFVPYFTVFSPKEAWLGSKGPASPLYCEFLSPWILYKEISTILDSNGIEFICKDAFRRTKPTLFWNLVLFLSEFNLPTEFLVGPPPPTATTDALITLNNRKASAPDFYLTVPTVDDKTLTPNLPVHNIKKSKSWTNS